MAGKRLTLTNKVRYNAHPPQDNSGRRGLPWDHEGFRVKVLEQLFEAGKSTEQVARMLRINPRNLRRQLTNRGANLQRIRRSRTAAATARLLGLYHDSVRAFIHWGYLKAVQSHRGGQWTITEDVLIDFLEDQRYWPLWEASNIRHARLRAWTTEMRTAAGDVWLTPKQVARHFQVTEGTAREWCRFGHLPVNRLGSGSGRWFVHRDDVARFKPPEGRGMHQVNQPWDDDERRLLVALRFRGLRWSQVARVLGRKERTVKTYYIGMSKGIMPMPADIQPEDFVWGRPKKRLRLSPVERRALADQWRAGRWETIDDAADAWGLAGATVCTITSLAAGRIIHHREPKRRSA